MGTDSGRRTVKSRRRGVALEKAIYEAVLAEIVDVGFGGLTFDAVAARARTGKASLYRRWSTREELVLDTLVNGLPSTERELPDTGSLRDDVLSALRRMNTAMAGPAGQAMASLIGQRHRHPQLASALRERLVTPRQAALESIFRRETDRRGVTLGEEAESLIAVGPALVVWYHLLDGKRLTGRELEAIVDVVLLPALERAIASAGCGAGDGAGGAAH